MKEDVSAFYGKSGSIISYGITLPALKQESVEISIGTQVDHFEGNVKYTQSHAKIKNFRERIVLYHDVVVEEYQFEDENSTNHTILKKEVKVDSNQRITLEKLVIYCGCVDGKKVTTPYVEEYFVSRQKYLEILKNQEGKIPELVLNEEKSFVMDFFLE